MVVFFVFYLISYKTEMKDSGKVMPDSWVLLLLAPGSK